jgi:hypothetical protein
MAFDLHQPVTGLPATGLFAAALAGGRSSTAGGAVRLAVLHCDTCGDEIPFNALAAVCRCSQECYGPSPAARSASQAA